MKTIKRFINGELYEIPVQEDGSVYSEDVRQASGTPSYRALVLQDRKGNNRIINPGEKINLSPEDHLMDMPVSIRGNLKW
jgi:hypothetical protein